MRNPATIITMLADRWPSCFVVYEKRRKPLRVGIYAEIRSALDGAITPKELRAALRSYTGNVVYRKHLIEGATRIGLDGEPAGIVSAAHAAAAIPARAPAPPAPPPPKRTSLSDLRAAGKQRRELTGAGG